MKKSVPILIAGPYTTPRCRIGGTLACRIRGDVPVDGITDAPIAWPFTRYRGAGVPQSPCPILILCGDLERAVRTEARNAVAHHFGVDKGVVTRWRRALEVGRITPGTQRSLRDHARAQLTNLKSRQIEQVKAGIAAGKTPAAIAEETGVPLQGVWRIRRGETFRD